MAVFAPGTSSAPGSGAEPVGLAVLQLLPRGRSLTDESWARRHRAILALLWVHVLAIPVYALARDYSPSHAALETLPLAVPALVATLVKSGRRVRAGAATFGLLSASAVLVHLSGGLIEMHFHYFVMVPVIALYQDWFPFLMAIGYVLFQHGLAGHLFPESVYNHPAAQRNPWTWASIHAFFVAGLSTVCLSTWRFNESALIEGRRSQQHAERTLGVLTATLESTADGILVVDRDGRMTNFNRKFVEMWGIPGDIEQSRDDSAALKHVADSVVDPEAFIAKVTDLYKQSVGTGMDEIQLKDGRVFERFSQPLMVGDDAAGRVWSFRDITDRKTTEESLRESLARDREAVERLKALDDSKNMLLNAVSHELRTPLTSILGYAELLDSGQASVQPSQRTDFLRRIRENALRLQSLLLSLFDIDRVARGVLEPQRLPTDVADLTRNVVTGMNLPEGRVQMTLEPVTADIDAGMIERVVENLVGNAVKHTPKDVAIRVRVQPVPDAVLICVEDEGRGVPEGLKQAVFEPFVQGDTPGHSPGTGIGLSLVARFAQLHGGRAWVEDRPGGGAAFKVLLPTEATEATEAPEAAAS